eukprot:1898217-Rhodomonas_salina.2
MARSNCTHTLVKLKGLVRTCAHPGSCKPFPEGVTDIFSLSLPPSLPLSWPAQTLGQYGTSHSGR